MRGNRLTLAQGEEAVHPAYTPAAATWAEILRCAHNWGLHALALELCDEAESFDPFEPNTPGHFLVALTRTEALHALGRLEEAVEVGLRGYEAARGGVLVVAVGAAEALARVYAEQGRFEDALAVVRGIDAKCSDEAEERAFQAVKNQLIEDFSAQQWLAEHGD